MLRLHQTCGRATKRGQLHFAARAAAVPELPSVGRTHPDRYVCDEGFEGARRHRHWAEHYGAIVVCAPQRDATKRRWPKALPRWLASIRQIIESVNPCLHAFLRLDTERPHALDGLQARLAATCALHNVCVWLNRQLGRPNLGFAELIDW